MIYSISTVKNTHNLLIYDHAKSMDYRLFQIGSKLQARGPLIYNARKESYLQQMHKYHMIESTGPTLFSEKLRNVVEAVAPNEAEFFPADIVCKENKIEGFYAINPLCRFDCVDMSKSEHEQINFDKNNPQYTFYYEVLLDEIPYGSKLVICNEFGRQIVIDRTIKDECVSRGLKGLRFCRSIDTAQGDRSECETT